MSIFAKRKIFETQRAKPWHIVSSDKTATSFLLCNSWPRRTIHSPFIVTTDTLPEGQILCSRCEAALALATAKENDKTT